MAKTHWINRTRLELAVFYLQKAFDEINQVVVVPFADNDDPVWNEWSHTPELPAMLDLRDGVEAVTNLAEVLNYER